MTNRVLSLRTVGKKLLVPTLLLLVVLLGLLGTSLIVRTRSSAERMMSARGEAMASFMEQVGKAFVATYNLRELDVMTREAMKDPEIAFAAFYDDRGKLMTESAQPRQEPDDSSLVRYVRQFKDADGRPVGSLKLYYTTRSLAENMRQGFLFVLAGIGFTILLFGVGATLVTRRILRPIHELTAAAHAVVKVGDLRQNLSVSSPDEIGQLSTAFADMVEKLRAALANLQMTSQGLDSSVVALKTSNDEQGKTLSRQAAALQQTQTTAQEIKQTSSLTEQKASSVLEAMGRAEQVSRSGEAAVEQSLTGLAEIRDGVQQISARINQLGERAEQIAGITNTVKDLADRSNMLALNAAIEAARSGEHGKGFGVVAREIRSLADQSIQATDRVREILSDIGGAIRDAVSMTQSGSQRIENGLVQVKSSGDSLRELSGIVKENFSAARQIAAAVTQQNAGIVQIFAAVNDLSKMMDDSMARLASTNAAAHAVGEVSRRAAGIVKEYVV
ncbi:MAG TPA: methyl-accepting chemotaxis protein [Anaeromyxobacter sp.]